MSQKKIHDAGRQSGADGGINLALSGGGFRATLFHLGSLWRLNELGLIERLRNIASVSGGSITAAYLGLQWTTLDFDNGIAKNFEEEIVAPLRRFCSTTVDVWAIAKILPRPWSWRRAGNTLEAAYRRKLYGKATLQDLPKLPRFVIMSTNILSGMTFRFSRSSAGGVPTGFMRNPSFRLSEAVAASSAFPPVLSPFVLRIDPTQFEVDETFDEDAWPMGDAVYLTDAGVIDNLGLEDLYPRPECLLVSDAGAPAKFEPDLLPLWISLSKRTLEIAIYQAIPIRQRLIKASFLKRKGAYWGINSDIRVYKTSNCLNCPANHTKPLAEMRTRLNRFSESEQCTLINWGYAICDAAVREIVHTDDVTGRPEWPYPNYSLNQSLGSY